ncbi:MAG: sigma-70 family RNA polymerase sigma factor [Bacteroidota bacterium]
MDKKWADKELFSLIQKGDSLAFRYLFDTYADVLFNYGLKITPDREAIKDSIQDVFSIIWEKRNQINIQHSLKYYLFSMFRRELIRKLKQKRNTSLKEQEMGFDVSIESKIILDESRQATREELQYAIKQLTPRQKEIVFLRYYENLQYKEIEEIMSLNPNSLYKLLSAAIKRLRNQFGSGRDEKFKKN